MYLNQLVYSMPLLSRLTLGIITINLDNCCLSDKHMKPLSYLVKLTHLSLSSDWLIQEKITSQ